MFIGFICLMFWYILLFTEDRNPGDGYWDDHG